MSPANLEADTIEPFVPSESLAVDQFQLTNFNPKSGYQSPNKDHHYESKVPTQPEATPDFQRTTSPESKSVKFLSPIHQVLTMDPPYLSSTPPAHDRDQQANPLYAVSPVFKDVSTLSTPSDSLSEKQSNLDAVLSFESLDPTMSEVSLSSRRSLPVTLRPGKHNAWTSFGPQSLQDELRDGTDVPINGNKLVKLVHVLIKGPCLPFYQASEKSFSCFLHFGHIRES